jgi:dienelactone hydrolase
MAEEGDPVPAYLLIPKNAQGPLPAIVAHHQCNMDCDLGKEAVVGKVVDRPDQAYGLELVRRGFVVLAPDTKSCGQRPAQGFRKEGEVGKGDRWKWDHCYYGRHIGKTLSMKFSVKQAHDSMRAVDYLLTLQGLVDGERIGMIGHSQGAGITTLSMAMDERVKVGVASCGALGGISEEWLRLYDEAPKARGLWLHEQLELLAPRCYLFANGRQEPWLGGLQEAEFLAVSRWVTGYARYIYALHGVAPERIQSIIFPGGHCFHTDVRQQAYEFLEKYLTPGPQISQDAPAH